MKIIYKHSSRDHEEFIAALEEFIKSPEKPLSDKLQTAINFQYRIQVRNSTDAYKRAVSFLSFIYFSIYNKYIL